VTWIAPDHERSEDYPARRNEPEREMLRDWLDWHRATLLRKCAGLDATRLATRAVPPSSLSLLGLVRHMSDTERGWVRQTYRGEQVSDLYYRSVPPARTSKKQTRLAPRRTSGATGPSAGPSMPRWRARSWTTPSRSGRRPPRCAGCGSTSWRSTRGTTDTPTCSARPSTARPACKPELGQDQRLARRGAPRHAAHAERAVFLAAPLCADGALSRVSGEGGLKGEGGAVKGSAGDVLGGLHHGAGQ
jgi:hypothetical protein